VSAAGARVGRRDVVGLLTVLLLSTTVAVVALGTADGVTSLGGGSYATEFISPWCWSAFLLVPLPVLTARRRLRAASDQGLALVLPQVVAAAVCVARYRSSGWGDGLEGLVFLHPLLLLAIAGGSVMGARHRR